jgi:hypothetical protein
MRGESMTKRLVPADYDWEEFEKITNELSFGGGKFLKIANRLQELYDKLSAENDLLKEKLRK